MIMSKIKIHWAGRDADGRSCLKSEEVEISGVIGVHRIWTGLASEPAALGGRAETRDLGVAPGSFSWMIGRFEPGFAVGDHRSDIWDLHAIVQGSAISILDDGRHELTVGDFLIVQGVDHAWEAGPEGYFHRSSSWARLRRAERRPAFSRLRRRPTRTTATPPQSASPTAPPHAHAVEHLGAQILHRGAGEVDRAAGARRRGRSDAASRSLFYRRPLNKELADGN